MEYREASRIFNIPVSAFRRMKKKGLIDGDEIIRPKDKPYLMFLCEIWGDNEFLRMQILKKSKKVRLSLMERPELTRVERHILTRFKNHYNTNNGEWLYAEVVEGEVSSLFKVPLDQRLRNTVRRMRQKAKNDIKQARKVSK